MSWGLGRLVVGMMKYTPDLVRAEVECSGPDALQDGQRGVSGDAASRRKQVEKLGEEGRMRRRAGWMDRTGVV